MTPNLYRCHFVGRVAMALFAFNAAMPLIRRAIWATLAHPSYALAQVFSALEGLTTFVGVIFFLVWLARATAAVRLAQGSRFSPGMAVGGWFIPFANFVLPLLSLGDVWKRVMKGANAWVPALWWGSYLLTIVFKMVWSIPSLAFQASTSVPGIGYLSTLATVAAFGSWAFMLYSMQAPAEQRSLAAAGQ